MRLTCIDLVGDSGILKLESIIKSDVRALALRSSRNRPGRGYGATASPEWER
jgi:hypothetical protein